MNRDRAKGAYEAYRNNLINVYTFTEEQKAVVYALIDQALEDVSDAIEFGKEKTFMERTFDLTNCKNCGAPLSRYSCKCEYCGTVYGIIDEWEDLRLFADGKEFVRATSAGYHDS